MPPGWRTEKLPKGINFIYMRCYSTRLIWGLIPLHVLKPIKSLLPPGQNLHGTTLLELFRNCAFLLYRGFVLICCMCVSSIILKKDHPDRYIDNYVLFHTMDVISTKRLYLLIHTVLRTQMNRPLGHEQVQISKTLCLYNARYSGNICYFMYVSHINLGYTCAQDTEIAIVLQ